MAEVLSAARLPLDNERLAARARAQVVELTASQARIIESGDAERRRLERDLHDGAQQRLVALMLALRLARATASAADAGLIESVVVDLREVVAAVRRVASGIYPAVLAEAGLRGALAALAEDVPGPVRVRAVPADRFPVATEAVVYRLVSVMASSGAIEVGIHRSELNLVVDIAATGDPGPLTDVEDRTGALGGTLVIDRSAPGISVHAELPCG
ncbi:histidine kinase [Nakamurella sp.]|uniref:histidine kinase n=1 Tax=Nakamurella sp. TaxID=1869182 RepID=UPI003783E8D2